MSHRTKFYAVYIRWHLRIISSFECIWKLNIAHHWARRRKQWCTLHHCCRTVFEQLCLCLQRIPQTKVYYADVLRSSQPNGVMSSAVRLPNHSFFWTDLVLWSVTSMEHILSPETDSCPSWISGREKITIECISWSRKNVADPLGVEPATSWSQVERAYLK